MNVLLICASLLACGWLSWFGTKKFLLIAMERKLVDIPNHRSSHSTPTPRGGGIVFALVFLAGIASLTALHILQPLNAVSLFAGALIAIIGFWDDCSGLPILSRLFAQVFVSAIAVVCVLKAGWIQGWGHPLLLLIIFIEVLAFVWLINLTNFMDGIDGIATTEIICVASICAMIVLARHDFDEIALAFALLAVSTSGFLFWNWPPASVFMGDAGSCFLGYSLGALILTAVARGHLSLIAPLILLAVFIIDATLTLTKRFIRGERWYLPHCTHAFQHAAKRFGHLRTTLCVAGINIFWLGPLAVLAEWNPTRSWLILVVAWLPLIFAAHLLHAGEASSIDDDKSVRRRSGEKNILTSKYRMTFGNLRFSSFIRSSVFMKVVKILLLVAISCLSLYMTLQSQIPEQITNGTIFSTTILVWACTQSTVLVLFRMYRSQWHLISIEEIPTIGGMSLVAALVGALVASMFGLEMIGKAQQRFVLFECLFLTIFILGLQIATSLVINLYRSRIDRQNRRRVLIFGADQMGADILASLRRLCPECDPLGFVDTRDEMRDAYVSGLPVLGNANNILNVVETYGVHELLLSSSCVSSKSALALVQLCKLGGIDCTVVRSIEQDICTSSSTLQPRSGLTVSVSFPMASQASESTGNLTGWSVNE